MKNSTTKKITTITTKLLNFIEVYMPKNDQLILEIILALERLTELKTGLAHQVSRL